MLLLFPGNTDTTLTVTHLGDVHNLSRSLHVFGRRVSHFGPTAC